eukprot:6195739-Pleurochrysis_carterae.AAC.1
MSHSADGYGAVSGVGANSERQTEGIAIVCTKRVAAYKRAHRLPRRLQKSFGDGLVELRPGPALTMRRALAAGVAF